jgi:hypothetical protein
VTHSRSSLYIYHTRKFHQHAVAGALDDAAVMLGDLRIDEPPVQRFASLVRAFFVRPHQPRIACHIGGEDRGQPAFDTSRGQERRSQPHGAE